MRFTRYLSVALFLSLYPPGACGGSSKFPISPDCDVISVRDRNELMHSHSAILTSPEHCVLFHIETTGTFLSRKPKKKELVKVPLKTLSKISSRARSSGGSGSLRSPLLRKLISVREESPWIEFFFTEFENRTMSRLQPMSFCHSETRGEGSIVSFQITHADLPAVGGTYTADIDYFGLALSFTADVAIEKPTSKAIKVRCAIGRGEVGQLFLSNTHYLYYTPYFRFLLYDAKIKRFLGDENEEFKEWGRERAILRGGLGDWVCASSVMSDLQCHGLRFNMTMAMSFQ